MSDCNVRNFIEKALNKDCSTKDKIHCKKDSICVGYIKKNIITFLESQNILIEKTEIELTIRRIQHILRNNKNPKQKVTLEQLNRIKEIISEGSVYFDTEKRNLIYVMKLPKNEILQGRDLIKMPINLRNRNVVATASIIPEISIVKDKRYKKID